MRLAQGGQPRSAGSVPAGGYAIGGTALGGRNNRNGVTIYQVYDNANRLTTIDYPAGTDTTFTYDAASRKLTLSDTTGTTTY